MQIQYFLATFCAVLVVAQDRGIVETIGSVPELSQLSQYLSEDTVFASWLSELQNITFLAPDNEAFERLFNSSNNTDTADNQLLTDVLMSYHVLHDVHNEFGQGEYEFISTELQDPEYVNVTGGQIVVAKASSVSNATSFWSGLMKKSTSDGDSIIFTDGIIHIIDNFLTVPLNFTSTISEERMLGGAAFSAAEFSLTDSNNAATLDELSDVTVFLPMNYSLREIGNIIETLSKPELDRIISYHVLDQVLDLDSGSPLNGSFSTMEGSEVSIFTSNGRVFVNNARIVGEPNWRFSGGVIYTIYGVLNPDNATVDPSISDAEVAFDGAVYTEDFNFPASLVDNTAEDGSSDSAQSSADSSGTGLSTGEKAGIGAGVAVGVILVAGLVGMYILHRRRTTRYKPSAHSLKELPSSQRHLTTEMAFTKYDR